MLPTSPLPKTKKILIVGNGPSADTQDVARAIANADTVMRINRFPIGKYLNKRCHIWGTSMDPRWPDVPPGVSRIWWTGFPFDPNKLQDRSKEAYWAEISKPGRPLCERVASYELLMQLANHFKPMSPSTGIVLIAMALELPLEFHVSIAGFDSFLASGLHYYNNHSEKEARQWHNPELEAEYIRTLITQGKVRVIR